jgi:hypothetical protein
VLVVVLSTFAEVAVAIVDFVEKVVEFGYSHLSKLA